MQSIAGAIVLLAGILLYLFGRDLASFIGGFIAFFGFLAFATPFFFTKK
jgi:hypothetical protein